MFAKYAVVALLVVVVMAVSESMALTSCRQRSVPDFRSDASDCRRFHMCSLGNLVPFSCSAGSVFHEQSHACVPQHSYYDTCSSQMASKQRCPSGTRGSVAHPTQCAQYYDCGAGHAHNHPGWVEGEGQLKECPHPYVFSESEGRCLASSPGICGTRVEPLDQCDYKQNQCEGHVSSSCIPCHLRFPSCRGLQDGANAWSGRQGSPYYVTCLAQRVVASGLCEQKNSVVLFDQQLRRCVKQEEVTEKPKPQQPVIVVPQPVQQSRPGFNVPVQQQTKPGMAVPALQTRPGIQVPVQQQTGPGTAAPVQQNKPEIDVPVQQSRPAVMGYIPQQPANYYQQSGYLGNQNSQARASFVPQAFRPQYQAQVPARNQYGNNQVYNQYTGNQNRYNLNQY